jgi:hypothetical protein
LEFKSMTANNTDQEEKLGAVAGVGVGGAVSLATLSSLGTVSGLSAAGITSGLTAAGGLVGGGMLAGLSVVAAPVAVLGFLGYSFAKLNAQLDKDLLRESDKRISIEIEMTRLEEMLMFEHDLAVPQ